MKTNLKPMQKAGAPFRQTSKIGVAGLFQNQLMANNSSIPIIGKGATELHYSDRTCYEVIEVSEDLKTVTLEHLEAFLAVGVVSTMMGHQNWILKPTGHFITVQYRGKGWKLRQRVVTFTKEWAEKHPSVVALGSTLTPKQREAVYGNRVHPLHVVDGITREKFQYFPISLLFGVKDYHYDWEF